MEGQADILDVLVLHDQLEEARARWMAARGLTDLRVANYHLNYLLDEANDKGLAPRFGELKDHE